MQSPSCNVDFVNLALDTGDVILFNRRCWTMSAFGAVLCQTAKFVASSDWDHVGVIVKRVSDGKLMLLEATLRGVRLRPFDERLIHSTAHAIQVRRLKVERTDLMRTNVDMMIARVAHHTYNSNPRALLNAAVENLTKQN